MRSTLMMIIMHDAVQHAVSVEGLAAACFVRLPGEATTRARLHTSRRAQRTADLFCTADRHELRLLAPPTREPR